MPQHQESTNKWETEAELIDPEEASHLIFRNRAINGFLDVTNKHFVIASKGVGKTLLLKLKRFQISREFTSQPGVEPHREAVTMIPEGRPYLDLTSDLFGLDSQHVEFLSNWQNAKALWILGIQLSILSNLAKAGVGLAVSSKSNRVPMWLRTTLEGQMVRTPSGFFDHLVGLSVSEFQHFRNSFGSDIDRLFKERIHSGFYVFVDRLDQALDGLPTAAWIAVQVGLMEAAWDLMRRNHHVKLYCSVRQEAFYNYESPNKLAIMGEVSQIEYSRHDLEDLLNKLVNFYEAKQDFCALVGIGTVQNRVTKELEKPTEYLIRHTLGRPRDLVALGGSVAGAADHLDANVLVAQVNKASDIGIAQNIFSEHCHFLDCLAIKEQREAFFALISENILTEAELRQIARAFNHTNHEAEPLSLHPFCELYNVGLLGVIGRPDWGDTDELLQTFRVISEIREMRHGCIPKGSPAYLIHPCLNNYIKTVRKDRHGESYHINELITVGNGKKWLQRHTQAVVAQRLIAQLDNPAYKTECSDLLKKLPIADKEQTKGGIHRMLEKVKSAGDTADGVLKIAELLTKLLDNWP